MSAETIRDQYTRKRIDDARRYVRLARTGYEGRNGSSARGGALANFY